MTEEKKSDPRKMIRVHDDKNDRIDALVFASRKSEKMSKEQVLDRALAIGLPKIEARFK